MSCDLKPPLEVVGPGPSSASGPLEAPAGGQDKVGCSCLLYNTIAAHPLRAPGHSSTPVLHLPAQVQRTKEHPLNQDHYLDRGGEKTPEERAILGRERKKKLKGVRRFESAQSGTTFFINDIVLYLRCSV